MGPPDRGPPQPASLRTQELLPEHPQNEAFFVKGYIAHHTPCAVAEARTTGMRAPVPPDARGREDSQNPGFGRPPSPQSDSSIACP